MSNSHTECVLLNAHLVMESASIGSDEKGLYRNKKEFVDALVAGMKEGDATIVAQNGDTLKFIDVLMSPQFTINDDELKVELTRLLSNTHTKIRYDLFKESLSTFIDDNWVGIVKLIVKRLKIRGAFKIQDNILAVM